MSVKPCSECGGQVSTKAESCPHCGATSSRKRRPPPRRTSPVTWLVFFLFVVPFFYVLFTDDDTPSATENKPETREERIQSGFSGWDGAHRSLETLITKSLRDPDSYEHIETKYIDKGDHLIVITQYRARNGFGGMNVETASARVSLDGEVLEILSQ